VRRHLTYPNVMSTLAVFLVLAGGTALAATLPKNSVNSKTLKDNSLTSADLADGRGVKGVDVADGSLSGADLADGSLGAAAVADGSLSGADLAPGSIGPAQLGPGAVGAEQLAPDSVGSSSVLNNSLRGADVRDGSLTGEEVDESMLTGVANANRVFGHSPSGFLSSDIYVRETAFQQGQQQGDGTFTITQGCDRIQDLLLAGGPLSLRMSGDVPVVESALTSVGRDWRVVVGHGELGDTWKVAVICARQHDP